MEQKLCHHHKTRKTYLLNEFAAYGADVVMVNLHIHTHVIIQRYRNPWHHHNLTSNSTLLTTSAARREGSSSRHTATTTGNRVAQHRGAGTSSVITAAPPTVPVWRAGKAASGALANRFLSFPLGFRSHGTNNFPMHHSLSLLPFEGRAACFTWCYCHYR